MTTGLDRTVVATRRHRGDLVDDLAGRLVGDLAEDRVLAVQVRGRAPRVMKNCEPLVPLAHALAGVRHRQQVGLVEDQLGVDLVVERVAGAAGAGAQRAAALDHEAVDDPVEAEAVVELAGGRARRSADRRTPWCPVARPTKFATVLGAWSGKRLITMSPWLVCSVAFWAMLAFLSVCGRPILTDAVFRGAATGTVGHNRAAGGNSEDEEVAQRGRGRDADRGRVPVAVRRTGAA